MASDVQVADRLVMPPPAPRPGKRKVVLEEDVYAGAIEAVVERDFFPHIPKLQNQLEWLHAVQSGDPAQIKRAQLNIARRRAGLKTPLPHEAPATTTVTPGTGLLRTPAMTPALGGGMSNSSSVLGAAIGATPPRTPAAAAAALEQQGVDPVTAQQHIGAKAPAVSLDEFFSAYEGEDNASFQRLQQRSLQRKRAKVAHHLEDKNKPLLLTATGYSTDEYGTSGQTPGSLQMTRHVPKNTLYYDTSQQQPLALTGAEKARIVQGPPKSIDHNATRSLTQQQEGGVAAEAAAVPAMVSGIAAGNAAGVSSATDGRVSKAAAAVIAPGTKGYGYMKTPQIVPGVDASPIMTWGDIASTPLRLDADVEDIEGLGVLTDEAGASSRHFTMPRIRSREVAAQQMFAGRSAAAASRRQGASTSVLNAWRAGSGLTPRHNGVGNTPVRGAGLSAAGMKLAQQLKGGRPPTGLGSKRPTGLADSEADLQLRASYHGGATPSRGGSAVRGSWDMTPSSVRRSAAGGCSIGSSRQQRPLSGRVQVAKQFSMAKPGKAAQAGAAAAGQPAEQVQQGTTNITDDLLQLE
eukprot:GHRR01004091.1.p1 GENE.GHRR01004091.1~~GHRR01004091.1.p1  ORF type:complete len:577 (+),score=239.95 GHRR01004091.1:317-2047(+)